MTEQTKAEALMQAGAQALRAYLVDCDAHSIAPDVGGAWYAAYQAGCLHAKKEALRERQASAGCVIVPVEVMNLYHFMCSAFVPVTSQHEQINISLQLAKKAVAAARVQQAAPATDCSPAMDAVIYAEAMLTNLQPHIPQSCYPGSDRFIDNYVNPVLEKLRSILPEYHGRKTP